MKKWPLIFIFVGLSQNADSGGFGTNPILFVTQFPISQDFATIGSTFANHLGTISEAGRGGDLYIRYADGTLRNLTKEAGFGNTGFQAENAIAVRDPMVHFSGTKALFSMVIGAPSIFQHTQYYWQMYEISGFHQGQNVVITKIPNQPENYNNITPIYASNDDIIYTSDLPRTQNRHNYPQKDEYESTPTNTGLWKLKPQSGQLTLMQHSPSGSFSPFIDSYGRIVFTRWDHLQRDQQASPINTNGAFNYTNENASAVIVDSVLEVFPEPRPAETELLAGTNLEGHRLNHFFPWQLNQDGTEEETLNHIGRHEFHSYFNRSINDDENLNEFFGDERPNENSILNAFMLDEDPNQQGRYVAIEAPEFGTHSGGQIIAFDLPVGARPDLVTVDYLTHESTREPDDNAPVEHIGFSRDPVILSNGTLLASHTSETRQNGDDGTRENPMPRYDFKLKSFELNSQGLFEPNANLAQLQDANISYYDPDVLVTYNGPLWQLQAVEVVAKAVPVATKEVLLPPEIAVLNDENIDVTQFKAFLKAKKLAVVVMRDVTTRDLTDKQQPYNLKVASSDHQTIGSSGKIYEVSHMQFFQGDQIRGSGGITNPDQGQRVLAQYMHDENAINNNIVFDQAPPASAEVYADGSVSFFVPAQRAMTWQTLDPQGVPVVRERYWVSFQPGEIRACGGCHGVNHEDQSSQSASEINAQAFRALLQHWQQVYPDNIFSNGFD